jgi:hypothetical protein
MVTDSEAMPIKSLRAKPIFVMGILHRSGTNFLVNLICSHPDCALPAPVWEDFLVAESNHLARYVDRVSDRWDHDWGDIESLRNQLATSLGAGLTSFLDERCDAPRTVTKTPSVEHLENFFKFFPQAHLVILVRDGRAVVESGTRSFGWNREWAMHKWAKAATQILDFDRKHKRSSTRYRIVRYEDLYEDLEGELRGIFDFLGLDADRYDFGAASELPVRGSSTIRNDGADVHWEPIAKETTFDPMSRFSHWTRAQHERFNRIAGQQLEQLGYSLQKESSGQVAWAAWSSILDVRWKATRFMGPKLRKIKNRISRPRGSVISEE